jgi:hypothetical protein
MLRQGSRLVGRQRRQHDGLGQWLAAGLGSATGHQAGKGVLIEASPDVLIGGPTITMEEPARADALAILDQGEAAMLRWNS